MSRLKLFRTSGLERNEGIRFEADTSGVLSFHAYLGRLQDPCEMSVVLRARLIHKNRRCPYCRHPVVEPIELGDAVVNRSNLPIPGTATLAGFLCDRCRAEWPI